MSVVAAVPRAPCCVLAFDSRNRLAIRTGPDGSLELPFVGSDLDQAVHQLESAFPDHTPASEQFTTDRDGDSCRVFFAQVEGTLPPGIRFAALEEIERAADKGPLLASVLAQIEPHVVDIPYLHLGENDYIYKFRAGEARRGPETPRDLSADSLYQSRLCEAIKAIARLRERSAEAPRTLDFGPVQYVIPSHFGFCLGVKNAIERAYETLAENPGRRVFMLSELIHNPFVNEDLVRRGLRYLQSDRGVPYAVDGRPAPEAPGVPLLWDTLTSEDVVVIPAFGATNEDKARLVRKGLPIFQYDATCMLVEKVWRAARAYGREGYTVVIHGKHEHEETKATFSAARRHAPAVIVRDLGEARRLGEIVLAEPDQARSRFQESFAARATPGFDPVRDLARIAVVNQTTLLMNETVAIIEHLQSVYRQKFGDDSRVGGGRRRDTLCYATQVNQDALGRALAEPLDYAFVVGGRNSSNTYQLYRLCERALGARAFYITSEKSLLDAGRVEHALYGGGPVAQTEIRPLWPDGAVGPSPRRILITGGASCPDGIIQQVITRLNSFFPADRLRPMDAVLADLEQ